MALDSLGAPPDVLAAVATDPARLARGNGARQLIWAIAIGTFLIALGVRLAAILTVYRWIDSDQAVVGLMARHILQGERPIFFYGQPYNGALEAYLTAPIIALWGANDLTIRLIPVGLSAAFAALGAATITRLLGPMAGALTGAYLAAGPPLLLRWTTAAGAGYVEALLLGTLVIVLAGAPRWPVARKPWRSAVLGLCMGGGLWADPLIVPYLAALMLVATAALSRRRLRPTAGVALACAGGMALGLGPVLLHDGWGGLPGLLGLGTGAEQGDNWLQIHLAVLGRLLTESGPVLLACARASVEAPVFYGNLTTHRPLQIVGILLTLAILVFIVSRRAALARALRRIWAGNGHELDVLALAAAITVVLFAGSRYGTQAWATRVPRYLLPLYGSAGLLLAWPERGEHMARQESELSKSRRTFKKALIASVIVAGLIVLNMLSLASEPTDMDLRPLADLLLRDGTTTIFADYWVANRLTFETDERLIGVAIDPDLGIGPYQHRNRYHPYVELAQTATHVAWILPLGSGEQPLRRLLSARHIKAQRVVWGPFAVYANLSQAVRPPDLATGGRI